MKLQNFLQNVTLAFLLLGTAAISFGQEKATPADPVPTKNTNAAPKGSNELTVEAIQDRIKSIEENNELEAATKAKALDNYAKTLAQLNKAADATALGEQYAKLTRDAPETLQQIKASLAKPAPNSAPVIAPDATLAQIQSMLSQAESNFNDAQKTLQALKDEPKRRADLRLEIPKYADSVKQQLADIEKQLETKPAPGEAPEITTSAHAFLEARKRAIAAEAAAAQVELQYFEASGDLLSAQRDRAAQRVLETEEQAKALRAIVNDRRRQEAEQQAIEATRASVQAHPAVRKIAEANAALATRRQTLATKIEKTAHEVERIDQIVETMDEQFNRISKRYDTAGTTEAIGLLLRKQRDDLPNRTANVHEINRRTAEIADACLDLIDDEERRSDLATIDRHVKDIMMHLRIPVKESEAEYLKESIRQVLEAQRDLYDSLIADMNSYLDNLVEADVRQRQLIAKVDEYAAYADERILWIRSAKILGLDDMRQLLPSLSWLMDGESWVSVGYALWNDVLNHPLQTALFLAVLTLLILFQRYLRTKITEMGDLASRSNNTAFNPTLWVLLMTGTLALAWPSLLYYLGQALTASEKGSEFIHAVGQGLKKTAIIYATFEMLRQVCRRNGLGEAHFAWNKSSTRLLRSAILWFMICGLPLILIVTITESQSNEFIKNSFGRLAFLGTLIALMVSTHRVMRPVGGALESAYAAAPQAWATHLKTVWYGLALLCPISIGVLSLSGYHYTSVQLAWRLLATFWLVIGLLIVHATLIRWSLLSYRDLAMRKARERRAEAAAGATPAGTPAAVAATVSGKTQEEVALSDINKQSRKALQLFMAIGMAVGVWLIWGDIMPALGALRNIELWMVETASTEGSATTTVLKPVTLADLLLAIVIGSLTFTASRNLPSLLEMALLQRLPLDAGVRYAITTVIQYAITAAGFITAFGVMGIGWNKVQWLVAAIGVGLGFGLQEIFANFISGLILLFEQPVRLGDIVTVGDVSGNVTRIQMRATTITDWDMRELVVPNKEFITSRVMNWTLSSKVSRMSITVNVTHEANPDRVRSLLLEIATRNPLVIKEPPPHALFDDFGTNSLTFVLRVYMATRGDYLEMRHGLLRDIAREFAREKIEFAFPLREIHIRPADLEPVVSSLNGSLANSTNHKEAAQMS